MSRPFRIAFLGFSAFERSALSSYFRLAANRHPSYEQVQMLTDAELLIADADHAPSVQLVQATERLGETVFIGQHAPAGAKAMARPIDALHVMRELDAMVLAAAARAGTALGASAEAPARPRAGPSTVPGRLMPAAALAPPSPSRPTPFTSAARDPQTPTLLERATTVRPPALPAAAPPSPVVQPLAALEPRALLIDDSEIAQRYLEARLRPWGLQIDLARHSAQAFELMAMHSYDLIFVDVELGDDSELDGLALCQRIQQSAAAVSAAVVLISAHHSELDRVRGALAGCDAYLAKPLDNAELERLLRRHGLKPRVKAAAPAG